MEILHVPTANALLRTLSFIGPLDLTMDPPTRGGMFRRWYWEEVKAKVIRTQDWRETYISIAQIAGMLVLTLYVM